MKKNLKIAITPEQPLDEVVREVERLGYKPSQIIFYATHINTTDCGTYLLTKHPWDFPLTTLAELKEME